MNCFDRGKGRVRIDGGLPRLFRTARKLQRREEWQLQLEQLAARGEEQRQRHFEDLKAFKSEAESPCVGLSSSETAAHGLSDGSVLGAV